MSWQTIAITVAVVAAVGIYIYKYFNSKLAEPELTEIRQSLAAGARLVDVRTPGEFAAGHVDGAINIPVSQLSSKLKKLGQKRKPLVVYCRSGSRSGHAVGFLRRQGFKHVLDMKAMSNWAAVQAAPSEVTAAR
jgi:phage shock protein E